MSLVRTSLLNGLAHAIRTLAAFGLNKILAIFVGPGGYAAVGQLQNAISMILTFSGAAVNTGVTKYTSEYSSDDARQAAVWRTAATISFVGSSVVSLLLIAAHRQLSVLILHDPDHGYVFLWLAGALLFYVFNSFLLAVLNGREEIGRYVVANIAGSVSALLVTGLLVLLYGLKGALIGVAVNQSVAFFATYLICARTSWFRRDAFLGQFDRRIALNLGRFSLMALTSTVAGPMSQLLIRTRLAQDFGWDHAGYWEAMNRISSIYLGFAINTLAIYYLPKMSSINGAHNTRKELFDTGKYVALFAIISGVAIYALRDLVIYVALDKSFAPMSSLFGWQTIGDALRIVGSLFAYLLVARAMTKSYILIEVTANAAYVALAFAGTAIWGFQAVAAAYAAMYLFYALACGLALRLNKEI